MIEADFVNGHLQFGEHCAVQAVRWRDASRFLHVITLTLQRLEHRVAITRTSHTPATIGTLPGGA